MKGVLKKPAEDVEEEEKEEDVEEEEKEEDVEEEEEEEDTGMEMTSWPGNEWEVGLVDEVLGCMDSIKDVIWSL